jgi:dTDP-4-dehydrorhamnose reductase
LKIALIGAKGQLGTDLSRAFVGQEVVEVTHQEVEVTDPASVSEMFLRHRPEAVINTAAFHRVDDCETQIEFSLQVNAIAVRNLAIACRERNATFVHFSTDYVFGGERRMPYEESDAARPLSVYGTSKLAGEHLALAANPKTFVIRTCGLYGIGGSNSKGGNFVETMLRRAAEGTPLRVVADQVVTPTYTVDLARKVSELILTEAYGLYHISSNGSCSWFEFARRIFELAGVQANLSPTTSDAFRTAAKRPTYSVLRNRHLETLGMDDLPSWEDALRRYLVERESLRKKPGIGRPAVDLAHRK